MIIHDVLKFLSALKFNRGYLRLLNVLMVIHDVLLLNVYLPQDFR